MNEIEEGMLSPYRVLDLTDEKGLICGKILGDLGADVIKIEKPGGDTTRNFGPFYHDDPDPKKSLFWFAYNTNKRGITLNLETTDGKGIFKKLVKTADIIVESFKLGYINKLGLGYPVLEKINPGIILISITPFGQTGPYKNWKTSDIVAWALGGYMLSVGDVDRPPVRISHHSHAYLQAGAEAAQGAIMAIYHRELSGEGQFVDVSIHDCVTRCTPERITHQFEFGQRINIRGAKGRLRYVWPCKDGYVTTQYWSGQFGKRWTLPLVRWMESEGIADDFIKKIDWQTFSLREAPPEVMERIEELTIKLFMSHTKAEILEQGLKHNAQVYPVANTDDIANNPQLADRGFWTELEHPELGTTIKYPGGFAKTTEAPPRVSRRAPLIGEHNDEIYQEELGFSKEALLVLKQAGVI